MEVAVQLARRVRRLPLVLCCAALPAWAAAQEAAADATLVAGLAVDITDRIRAEEAEAQASEALRRQKIILETLLRVAARLNSHTDLQAVLDLPQPTVSRHLQVLRKAELVRDTPVAQFVLYRLRRDIGTHGRLLSAILDAVVQDDADMRTERDRAAERSRSHTRTRVAGPVAEKAPMRSKRPT